MTIEAVRRGGGINRRLVLASHQMSDSPSQLLCVGFGADLLQLTFVATHNVPSYMAR